MKTYAAGAVAAALISTPAFAQAPSNAPTNADVAALRQEMQTLRHDYEARLDDLEARLAQAEADSAAAKAAAEQAANAPQAAPDANAPVEVAQGEPPPAAAPASANAFNPGIAAVLNGFYAASSHDSAGAIAGFATGDEIDGPPRGFSLGESEVSFAANIDPSLYGFLDFSISDANEISLEEGYIRTTALPGGLSLKAGRFLSGIGYINERHAHDWSFSDAPLPYRAFLNSQLGDDGVQVRWIAPTDQYLEFGGEVLRGDSFPAAGAAHAGAGTYALFAKTGADFNASSSYLAGLSYLHARASGRETGADLFTGDTDLGIATLVYKWAPNGNATTRNLILSGEYFWGREDGAFNGVNLSRTNTGWYAQGVYQFRPNWSAGLRVAGLSSEDPGLLLAGSALDDQGHSPFAATALLEMDTSEFGRLRLQYTRDEAAAAANDELTLQYTVIYGPHGAHRY